MDRGQASLEYVALLAVAAALVAAVASMAPSIRAAAEGAVCRTLAEGCEPPAAEGSPTRFAAGEAEEDDEPEYMKTWTSARGGFATVYEEATGAIVLLYELCGGSMRCLERELRRYGPDNDRFTGAIGPGDYDDLREAIEDVQENGGCLNVHAFRVGGGVNWSTRPEDDENCRRGDPFTLSGEDLGEQLEGRVELAVGSEAELNVYQAPSEQIAGLYSFCTAAGTAPGDCAGLIAQGVERELPDEASEGVAGTVWEEALARNQYEDLAGALAEAGGGGCLNLTVSPEGDDPYDWTVLPPGEQGCRRGEPFEL